jgi:hypothetical protein
LHNEDFFAGHGKRKKHQIVVQKDVDKLGEF